MNSLQRKEVVVRVARRLLEASVDEIVSLKQLSEAAGHDLSVERWVISSALKAVNSEYGLVFATVRKEGYRRLGRSEGVLFAGGRGLLRVRRASRNGMRVANNAARHANEMTADQRRQHNQQIASLSLIGHLTMTRTVGAMPETPQERPDPLAGLKEALGV